MFAVEIYAAVRRFVFVEGKSRREAARVFGLSRDTISKMCRYSAPPGYVRSKTPELVRQEFFGLLMAHFAIRGLMHEAALKADEDPDRLSFLHSVHVVQRRMARYAAIPPSAEKSFPRSDPRRNS